MYMKGQALDSLHSLGGVWMWGFQGPRRAVRGRSWGPTCCRRWRWPPRTRQTRLQPPLSQQSGAAAPSAQTCNHLGKNEALEPSLSAFCIQLAFNVWSKDTIRYIINIGMPQTLFIVYLKLTFNWPAYVLPSNPNDNMSWTKVPATLHRNLLSPTIKHGSFWAPT